MVLQGVRQQGYMFDGSLWMDSRVLTTAEVERSFSSHHYLLKRETQKVP